MKLQDKDNLPKCHYCNEPAEWVDEYCQECWEAECSRTWWEMVMTLGGVKLARPNDRPPEIDNSQTN